MLVFCHQHQLVDLTQPTLSLSTSCRPFMIDVIRTEKFAVLHGVLQSIPLPDRTASAQKLLTRPYTYGLGNVGKLKESLLSYACRAYKNSNPNILPSLLSPETLGCQLTHIKIDGIDLETVPLPVFSEKLTHLDLSKNHLDTLPIEEALSRGLCEKLQELIIANNAFSVFPNELFHLPCLTILDARNNQITTVPEDMWTAPRLEELYLCNNCIASLPCPDYIYLNKAVLTSMRHHVGTFPQNPPCSNSSEVQHIQGGRQSYLTATTPGSTVLARGFRLKILDLSNNQLSQIPRGLPCLTPQLRVLKLSNNHIIHLGHPCNYPQLLEKLDVNKNLCERCIQWCPEPPNLVCAQAQLQQREGSCFHIDHKVLSSLKFLFLEDNRLTCVMLEEDQATHEEGSWESRGTGECGSSAKGEKGVSNVLPTLMFPKLESLRLSNNLLENVPSGIHRHVEMRELKLDNNAGITQLPSNLHLLQELFFFTFDGIGDPVVSELKNRRSTPEQLLYLKARERESVPMSIHGNTRAQSSLGGLHTYVHVNYVYSHVQSTSF